MKRVMLSIALVGLLTGCGGDPSSGITQTKPETHNSNSTKPITNNQPVYTKEELEADPKAPSKDPSDYDQNGQYVPKDGPSDNPADYSKNGEYKPVESMTQEEIQAELEQMLKDSLGQ
ncbi:hypothetical protein ACFSO0_11905 [Brevibacillus sp. GCM10020057]|uniref:hypothetical protein n=1 Tax=Brevibacillus sp. GCM10020057 TaxID=3317327 RepID=UPI003627FADE